MSLREAAPSTLPQAWLARCRAQPEQVAMRHKRRGIWQPIRWAEFFGAVRAIGLALERFGLVPGEVVSIVSESRPEWLYADMAAQALGCISHGLYPTCPARRIARHLAQAGSRVLFVENGAQAADVLAAADRLPRLAAVIVFDERGLREIGDARVLALSELLARDARTSPGDPERLLETRIAAGRGEDFAFLCGTAGSTGRPRLAAITQASALRQAQALPSAMDLRGGDRVLCFVPLANAAERMLAAALPLLQDCQLHFPESPATVMNDLCEVQPDWVHAPPRLWEKLQARSESAAMLSAPRARRLYRRSIDGGGGWLGAAARRRVRHSLGLAQVRQVWSGGALAAPSLAPWYAGIGVSLRDLYESAETCGPCPLDPDRARLAADGELQLRPQASLAGYWSEGALQAAAMTADGWLQTGDLAVSSGGDRPGFRVTGRLSERFALRSGERVAPAEIEAALLGSSFIAGALLLGADRGERGLLIGLEEEAVMGFAQSEGIPFTDYANLVARPEVQALLRAEIDRLDPAPAGGRRIERFGLLPRPLSAHDGDLTPALRMHRLAGERNFAAQIEALFAA